MSTHAVKTNLCSKVRLRDRVFAHSKRERLVIVLEDTLKEEKEEIH